MTATGIAAPLLFAGACVALGCGSEGTKDPGAGSPGGVSGPNSGAGGAAPGAGGLSGGSGAAQTAGSGGIGGGHAPGESNVFPSSYQERLVGRPDAADAVACSGASNATAELKQVFFAQTHVMEPSFPLFYLIGGRPALVDVVVTGSGPSPEVKVEGFRDGASLGSLCLAGPAQLPGSVEPRDHRSANRFRATLPGAWLAEGLSLQVTASAASRSLTAAELKVGPPVDLNLILLRMDLFDYNQGKQDIPIPEALLEDLSGGLAVTRVRFGEFPGRIPLPSMVLTPASDAPVPPVLVKSKPCSGEAAPDCTVFDIDPHDVSAVASNYLDAIHRALGHYGFGISYGSTEHGGNGGWGGWGSFVGADFGGVFLHELGHAMSFPHWGNDYALTDPAPNQYNYPYAGAAGEAGGGRGDSWSYLQQLGEFISPLCEDQGSDNFGLERSDAMQRSKHCVEQRSTGQHEWDGFGDFSGASTYRFFAGAAEPLAGSVPHQGGQVPFQLRRVMGIGQLRRNPDGTRSVEYPPTATDTEGRDERLSVLFPQDWEAPASLIYGAYHPGFPEVNVVYGPVDFVGGLPEVVDPTDPEDFAELKAGSDGRFDDHFGSPRNFIVKISYENGSVLHALYPFEGFRAPGTPEGQGWTLGNGAFRSDVRYFAMVVPRPAQIMAVDVLYRPIVAHGASDMTEGNVSNPALGLTPANILEAAKLVTGWRR